MRYVTLIVIPPIRFGRHEIVEPLAMTVIGAPETATRTLVGMTAKRDRHEPPRRTTIGRPEAAIGAPQCVPQHHDETASRTWPGRAEGGRRFDHPEQERDERRPPPQS